MGNFSDVFSQGVFGAETNWMPLLNFLLALAAVPIGWLWRQWRDYPLLAIALSGLSFTLIFLLASPGLAWLYILVAIFWIFAFATVRNGTLPYIFATVPGRWAGFGIGVYYGVSGLANNLFPRIFAPENTAALQGVVGVCALAIAAGLALMPFLPKASKDLGNEV